MEFCFVNISGKMVVVCYVAVRMGQLYMLCLSACKPRIFGLFPSCLDILWKLQHPLLVPGLCGWLIRQHMMNLICLQLWLGLHGQLYAHRVFGGKVKECFQTAAAWYKPPVGVVKVNTDAAIIEDIGVGLGAAIRDESGRLVAYGVKRLKATWTPLMAEAAAAKFGVDMALNLGYTKVWLETDAAEIVRRVQGEAMVVALHVKRVGNALAHLIARICPPNDEEVIVSNSNFPQSLLALADLDND
ncbi:Deoxyribose-phosphate aldolase [Bienertia sinuspersici]